MGEGNFSFDTHTGRVNLETTSEAMSPFGGLVPFASFLKKSQLIEILSNNSPVSRSSPNASPIADILSSLILTSLCDGSRFNHVNRLRYDPVLPKLFGIKKVVGDDTIRRFLGSIDPVEGKRWFAKSTQNIWDCLPRQFILDWDSTVMTKYGEQEEAEVGYNPTKKGRPSFHPLMAVVAGTRLCPYYKLRAGNTTSASDWTESMEECLDLLGDQNKPALNRGDIGFGIEKVMKWHEDIENAPKYLFKLKITRKTRDTIDAIDDEEWEGASTPGLLQVTERYIQLSGWSQPRRVILGRRLHKVKNALEESALFDVVEYKHEAYVTDLNSDEVSAWQIPDLYNQRADCENVFDELKNQWGLDGFCSKKSHITEMAARFTLLSYNLWNLFSRVMEPGKHLEAKGGRRWFLIIASRLVVSAREKVVKISVSDQWKRDIRKGYERVYEWLNQTAPQLNNIFKSLSGKNNTHIKKLPYSSF